MQLRNRQLDCCCFSGNPPDGEVAGIAMAQAKADPFAFAVRQAQRPEWGRLWDMRTDGFVIIQRFLHQFPAPGLKLGQMAALVHSEQQRIHHVEDDLFIVALTQRIRPDG
ncbi:hypothetical protein D3C75_768320 [compost metagenome]